jgi:hypothetical protein
MCHHCDSWDRVIHPERYESDEPWLPSVKRYVIIYADGHYGEPRPWESVLELISNGRHWRRYGGPAVMIPVRVIETE